MKKKQLIIIGAGPAGLTSGLFAQRYGLDFLMLGQIVGGTVLEAHTVDNYPGFKSISGTQLIKEFSQQIDSSIIQEDVKQILKKGQNFKVITHKSEYLTQSVILAMGTKVVRLNIKDEAKFVGKGVSYCAVCDGPFAKDKIAVVVGGGDSALTAALKVADVAKKTYLVHRRNEFRGTPIWVKKVKAHKKISIIYNANVEKLEGKQFLESIVLDTGKTIKTQWLFIEIGGRPVLDFCEDLKISCDKGFIKVDRDQATNLKGIFSAGNVTDIPFRQIVTACGQGAIATNSAYIYLKKKK